MSGNPSVSSYSLGEEELTASARPCDREIIQGITLGGLEIMLPVTEGLGI